MTDAYTAIIGGVGGGIATWIGQLCLESLRHRQQFRRDRWVAIQNMVFLVDLLIAYAEKPDSKIDDELWKHARKNCAWSGAFFPVHMQPDITELSRVIIREENPRVAHDAISRQALDAIRNACVRSLNGYQGWSIERIRHGLGLSERS